MSKVIGMTNYEIQQMGYKKIPTPTEQKINTLLAGIGAWLSYRNYVKYIGLLCRERYDFTIVKLNDFNYDKAVETIKEVMQTRGEIVDVRYNHEEEYHEIWVREIMPEGISEEFSKVWEPQVFMFIVFDANDWVIEC